MASNPLLATCDFSPACALLFCNSAISQTTSRLADIWQHKAARQVYARLADEIEGQLALLHDLVDVAAFNGMV